MGYTFYATECIVATFHSHSDFVLMSDTKRRELDELLLYIIDKRVTAEDAVRIFAGS